MEKGRGRGPRFHRPSPASARFPLSPPPSFASPAPPPRDVTPAEVAAHPDSWTVLRGRVYDVRGYAPFHPGGEAVLKPAYGKDATKLFDATHAWVNAHALLASCYVGRLVGEGGGGGK